MNHREDQSFGRIINEVNIIREQLRHPNVVNYYQIFVESSIIEIGSFCLSFFDVLDEKLYIRMELIMGLSLQAHLNLFKEMEKKMSEEQIWKILIQLILALRYLHEEKGIVHRDLSSNNIMVDDDYHVKISKCQSNLDEFLIDSNFFFSSFSGFRFSKIKNARSKSHDFGSWNDAFLLSRNHSTCAVQ